MSVGEGDGGFSQSSPFYFRVRALGNLAVPTISEPGTVYVVYSLV